MMTRGPVASQYIPAVRSPQGKTYSNDCHLFALYDAAGDHPGDPLWTERLDRGSVTSFLDEGWEEGCVTHADYSAWHTIAAAEAAVVAAGENPDSLYD